MSLDKIPFLSPAAQFPTASKALELSAKDILGASTPNAEQSLSHYPWLQDRQAVHVVQKQVPCALRRSSSALSRPSTSEKPSNPSGLPIRSHVSLEHLAPVKPLRNLRRVPGNSDLSASPLMAGSSACTMAEARELFEQHGIDRPAG